MKVALFITCFNDLLFPDTGKAVVGVLERLGHEVDFPAAQTCCGQMHFNTGYRARRSRSCAGSSTSSAGTTRSSRRRRRAWRWSASPRPVAERGG